MPAINRALSLTLLMSASVIAACGGKPAAAAPAPAPAPTAARPAVDTAATRRAREDSLARESARRSADLEAARARALADSLARVRAAEEAMRRDSEMLRGTLTTVINFELDKSDLTNDAKAALDAKIPIMLANSNVTVRIAGHADDRGSSEYNLSLGQRRAAAAKRYLVERGVAESRVETTSFGEERPLCTDQNEACWGRNRRDEFEITAGGPMLTRPRS